MSAVYANLGDLVRLVGIDGAQRLARSFGGTRVWIPGAADLKAESPIVLAVGAEHARRLAQEFAGCCIVVPKGVSQLREARNLKIRADATSKSIGEQARQWGLTERQISRLRRR